MCSRCPTEVYSISKKLTSPDHRPASLFPAAAGTFVGDGVPADDEVCDGAGRSIVGPAIMSAPDLTTSTWKPLRSVELKQLLTFTSGILDLSSVNSISTHCSRD